ncbi:MAG: RdgB/HAM1 family non-canonical purine NTP pyrophosphatase [Blastocatellia bacterium]
MELLIASTNKGKVEELREILEIEGLEVMGLDRLPAMTVPEETGSTFEENALLKAHYYRKLTGMITIADDSGLEVDALGGAPGVMSARYAGFEATDNDRVRKLLGELDGVAGQRRSARFICAAALVWQGGEKVFRGEANGQITIDKRGAGGFGFDPVFLYGPLGRTFAELSRSEKSSVSHRGIAFRNLAKWIKEKGLKGLISLEGTVVK